MRKKKEKFFFSHGIKTVFLFLPFSSSKHNLSADETKF